jgi:hypothetical protein
VSWRLKDLAQWLWEEFAISVSETIVSRDRTAAHPKGEIDISQTIKFYRLPS